MISNGFKKIPAVLFLFIILPLILFLKDSKDIPEINNKSSLDETYSINNHSTLYSARISTKSISIRRDSMPETLYDLTPYGKIIRNSAICDLNSDGNCEILLLLGAESQEYGDTLLLLSYDGSFHELYNKSISSLKPWKMQVCDVDGDLEPEISLGVFTVSAFHGDTAKRPFIYNFKQGNLYPKWLGSRLSKPFLDYIFCDIDSDGLDELISIEVLPEGKKDIIAYRWKGFGFEGIGGSKVFDNISQITKGEHEIEALVLEGSKWVRKAFRYSEGNLID